MPNLTIEQALADAGPGGMAVVARSPGFAAEWEPEFLRLAGAFGRPPAGEYLPNCVFAKPLARGQVAVVQAAAEGQPPVLRFHCLAVPAALYAMIGDPFQIAERFPPPWGEKVVLPTLGWMDEAPARSVDQVRRVLQEDDGPTLLGAAQAIVDGGRAVFERPFPAPELLHRLWTLLPDSTRAEVWPASYAFGPDLDVQAIVVPKADPEAFAGYLPESQAGDYPEGRYELNLQIAAEAGDQTTIDRLLSRRSARQTLWLAIMLLLAAMGLAAALRFLE
ncbi:MAG TPA: hypothetical protein VH120_12895 [Gemmataceae bacterium]|jgi:hypothetical protein|nr:hypothetical protein [Gemmataceae bacterium]